MIHTIKEHNKYSPSNWDKQPVSLWKEKLQSAERLRSNGAIKDELVYQLSSNTKISWTTLEITQKYHERAEFVLYRINIWNPSTPPLFVINISDLTQSIRIELEELQNIDPEGFDRVVTEAVQTLFDGINARYYHIAGLPYKVTWRFEP